MPRALELLRSKKQADGSWLLEKTANVIVPVGGQGCGNLFKTKRAEEVLAFYA